MQCMYIQLLSFQLMEPDALPMSNLIVLKSKCFPFLEATNGQKFILNFIYEVNPAPNMKARESTKDKSSLKLVHRALYKTSFIYNSQKLQLQRTKLKYIYTSQVSPSMFFNAPVNHKSSSDSLHDKLPWLCPKNPTPWIGRILWVPNLWATYQTHKNCLKSMSRN